MTKYSSGDSVTWSWGNGTASGTVEKVAHEKTEITSKGQTITRNGTDDNPAIVIKQDDGTKIVKLASELGE
ncbi:MAG: DUF2945 domain-containing protein [Alcaligenaceae bacterium]|nr:MAG: DUF2945 domain-containing protein [Alcaligenaceae bacterium]